MAKFIHKGDGNGRSATVCGAIADGWHWTVDLRAITCPECQRLLHDEITNEREAQVMHKGRMKANV